MNELYPNHGNYGQDIFIDEAEHDIDEEDGNEDSIHIFDHTDEVLTAASSPTDATLLAIGCKDDTIFLLKVGDGVFKLAGQRDTVFSLSFSADGRLLASGSLDGVVKIWHIAEEDSKCTFKCSLKCTSEKLEMRDIWMRWHPNQHLILVGGFEDCSVWMWNADEAACVNVFKGHTGIVTCGDFAPDGRYICTGSADATMRIIGENNHVVGCRNTEELMCLAITSDSSLALTGSLEGFVQLVYMSTGKVVVNSRQHSKSVECVAFKPSSRLDSWIAATAGMDGKLEIWDPREPYDRLQCYCEAGVTCLIWLADSRYIATGATDGKVRIWDSLSGDCAKILSGHSEDIQSISTSSNGDYLVSVSYDKTARVFDIAEFKS